MSGISATDCVRLGTAVFRLDAWLDSMRGPQGYGGPVVHWWQNCLQFTGAALDWRYEGIITGYVNLYLKTGVHDWLAKARRAGDDLVRGQLAEGTFRNSCFELNPYTGGTPHEAGCDLALLRLAEALRGRGDPDWPTYLEAAQRNIRLYYLERLWDRDRRLFVDQPGASYQVPNKLANLVDALLLLSRLTGDESFAELYALPTLEIMLAHQIRGGTWDGAFYQASQHGRFVPKFFPYYVARCVPGLLAGHDWTGQERFLDAACRAMAFVERCRRDSGGFPQVVYPGGRVNVYPQWIAPTGDILWAGALLKRHGVEVDLAPVLDWLLPSQQPLGGFPTAHGFGSQISQRAPGSLPEFRDLLPVAGWNDKAFAGLTELLPYAAEPASTGPEEAPQGQGLDPASLSSPASRLQPVTTDCIFRGQRMRYHEDHDEVTLEWKSQLVYCWRKGVEWADVCARPMLLK